MKLNEFITVAESQDPQHIYVVAPGITRLRSGRLMITAGFRGPGLKSRNIDYGGKVYTSDDHGQTWQASGDFPFTHARSFEAEGTVYIIGHREGIYIMRSHNNGDSWEGPFSLFEEGEWHQVPCNVWEANGNIYVVM